MISAVSLAPAKCRLKAALLASVPWLSMAMPSRPLGSCAAGLVTGLIRVCPVSVPCSPTAKIERGHCVVSMLHSWISWKQFTSLLVDNRCSNSLYTRYCTVAEPPTCRRKSSEHGTSVRSVVIWSPLIGSSRKVKEVVQNEDVRAAVVVAVAPGPEDQRVIGDRGAARQRSPECRWRCSSPHPSRSSVEVSIIGLALEVVAGDRYAIVIDGDALQLALERIFRNRRNTRSSVAHACRYRQPN